MSAVKKGCLSLFASLQECHGYIKAFFVGKAKTITARNEKEAAEADLQTAKMQVEAADTAEEIKSQLESDRVEDSNLSLEFWFHWVDKSYCFWVGKLLTSSR